MNSIFNYQTIDVALHKETRNLTIKFKNEFLNFETLFELESILDWTTGKIEIKSILLTSIYQCFNKGHDESSLKYMSTEKLKKFTQKLKKINYALHCMPQTTICDLNLGASNTALELATSCDIRLAHEQTKLNFNHTLIGLVPSSGGISTLGEIVGHGNAKSWILSALPIEKDQLQSAGFIFKFYKQQTKDKTLKTLLVSIHAQSDVNRIQTKLGLTEAYRNKMEELGDFATKLSNGAMASEDWKNENEESLPAKHFSTAVKLSLVKSDNEHS